jgi:hypothetical protein
MPSHFDPLLTLDLPPAKVKVKPANEVNIGLANFDGSLFSFFLAFSYMPHKGAYEKRESVFS